MERDSMGEVRVPADAKWGAQTQRAVENFPISGVRLERAQIEALARIKAAVASVKRARWHEDADLADAISGRGRRGRPRRARRPVPDRRVPDRLRHEQQHEHERGPRHAWPASGSAGRSTRTTTSTTRCRRTTCSPASIHVAATAGVIERPDPSLEHLAGALEGKAGEFADVVKAGRTHLMDATPVTLGQEFGGYAARCGWASSGCTPPCRASPSCRWAGPRSARDQRAAGLRRRVIAEVAVGDRAAADRGPRPLRGAGRAGRARRALRPAAHDRGEPHEDRQRPALDGLRTARRPRRDQPPGPAAGQQSIMPGKVNPVIPEATLMVCAQVIGNDAAIAWGGAAGNFELNVMLPMIGRNLLESIRCWHRSAACWRTDASSGITANVDRLREYAEGSPAIVTPLNPIPRLRGGGEHREAGARRAPIDPRGGGRARPRSRRAPHRGGARRGARRHADDPPLTSSARRPPRRA